MIFFWGFSAAPGPVYNGVSAVNNSGIYMNFSKVNIIYEQEYPLHSTNKKRWYVLECHFLTLSISLLYLFRHDLYVTQELCICI